MESQRIDYKILRDINRKHSFKRIIIVLIIVLMALCYGAYSYTLDEQELLEYAMRYKNNEIYKNNEWKPGELVGFGSNHHGELLSCWYHKGSASEFGCFDGSSNDIFISENGEMFKKIAPYAINENYFRFVTYPILLNDGCSIKKTEYDMDGYIEIVLESGNITYTFNDFIYDNKSRVISYKMNAVTEKGITITEDELCTIDYDVSQRAIVLTSGEDVIKTYFYDNSRIIYSTAEPSVIISYNYSFFDFVIFKFEVFIKHLLGRH